MKYTRIKKGLRRIVRWIRNLLLAFFILSLFFVFLYKYVPVYYTPLMLSRSIEQKIRIKHQWVPLSNISPHLVQAVVASEDNLFSEHNGFDFNQIEIAQQEAAKGKRLRGASTISQQTAKNVFLFPHRSWIRKGLEAYFTVLIEWVWGKRRIMEVYLNSIEMGDGIFGAQAVAEAHFYTTADRLTVSQSALIAASLPNPRRFHSGKPSAYLLKRQAAIISLMSKIMPVNFDNPPQKGKGKTKKY